LVKPVIEVVIERIKEQSAGLSFFPCFAYIGQK
jgi:hypothetical protein